MLTKTQAALFAKAKASATGTVGLDHGYQAGIKFGQRTLLAASRLVALGLFERIDGGSAGTPLYKAGYGQNGRVYSATYRLTETGRAR